MKFSLQLLKPKTILILLILGFFLSISIQPTNAQASIIQRTNERTYEVINNYVHVTETKKIQVNDNRWFIPSGSKEVFTLFLPQPEINEYESLVKITEESIQVLDQDNNIMPYTLIDSDSKNKILEVTLYKDITSTDNLEITLSYKSYGLSIKTGAVLDVFVPGFPAEQEFTNDTNSLAVNTTVIIPKSYGELNFWSPEELNITENLDSYVIDVEQANLLGKQAWVQVGTIQYFTFNIEQNIPATAWIPFGLNTIKMPIPREIQSGPITQKVYYTTISPEPSAMYLDEDENVLIEFFIPSNKEIVIHIEGYATLEQNPNYTFSDAGTLDDVPIEFERYLKSGNFWEVNDPLIQQTALDLKGESETIDEIIQNTFSYVVDQIDYSFVKRHGINNRQGALKTLQGGAAVCMEYSDLFITLLRAQGVPARGAFGYGFGSSDLEARSNNTINHQWAEVYLPKHDTWINIDTTWGEFGNNILGGDLNHFYSHVASIEPETPKSIEGTFFGSLEAFPERIYEINVVDSTVIENKPIGTSQSNLLQEFIPKEGLEYASFVFVVVTENVLNSLEDFISTYTPLQNQTMLRLTSLVIVILPIIFIMSPLFISLINIFRKKPNTTRDIHMEN